MVVVEEGDKSGKGWKVARRVYSCRMMGEGEDKAGMNMEAQEDEDGWMEDVEGECKMMNTFSAYSVWARVRTGI